MEKVIDGELREAPILRGWVVCIHCKTWFNPEKYQKHCPTCQSTKEWWKFL